MESLLNEARAWELSSFSALLPLMKAALARGIHTCLSRKGTAMTREIEFKVDSWTPATLPQGRLGEYLIEVAKLYGESASVHFEKLRKGTAILVSGPTLQSCLR